MVAKFQRCDEKVGKILDDKDSKNIKKASKGIHLIFKAHLQERNIQKPMTAEELGLVRLQHRRAKELATVSENSTPK